MTPERFSFFAFPVYPSQFCRKVFPVTRQDVALVDCMGRTSTAFVENCVDVFYLERCWKEFLDVIGALKGEHTLFEFTAARTFKVLFSMESLVGKSTHMWMHSTNTWCLILGSQVSRFLNSE
jgi:hypothetical protein